MKKISSLLALLVMTLTAFATDYTGHRTVTVGSKFPTESDDAVLTITDNGDNTFNVTFKDVINVAGIYRDNYGTFTFSKVAGTTENGVTTINLSNLSASVENCYFDYTEASEGVLFAKFNAEKAYARFSATIGSWSKYKISAVFGVDDFESTGGGETKEKYTVNFNKTAYTRSDRYLNRFSLQQTGKEEQTESVFALRAAYEDHTSKVFTVEAGSKLTASFFYSGAWMHGYVYIDRDNDGEFSYKEGQWDQTGTDLVAYSFYSELATPKVNDESGYNSIGDRISGNYRSNVNPPAFTAPTEPGTYRIRFKVDWNCILPGGSNDILSDGGGVWDATLKVVAAEPEVTSDKTYTSNLKLTDAESEEDVVDMPQADVNIVKYSDDSYKITLKQVALRGAENDLVFVGTTPEVAPTAEAAEPLYISATPNTATKAILGDVTATFAISEVSDDEIKMGIAIEGEGVLYEGEFNYEAKTPAAINATTVAEGEFEVFSVDGVKLAKLQKGLNIVRSADGKVKKVLVK